MLVQNQGNIAKWRKKEGDKVGVMNNLLNKLRICDFIFLTSSNESVKVACFYCVACSQIEVGDVICEIETDKATLEFESLEEG